MQAGLKDWAVQAGVSQAVFLTDAGQTEITGTTLLVDVEQADISGTALGRLGTGRGGRIGRRGRNTDINNSVLGEETGLVLLYSISSNTIWGSEFRSSSLALANEMGLHSLPS